MEVRVAATILATYLNLDMPMDLPTPKHVMDAHFASTPTHTVSTFLIERSRRLGMMLALVEDVLGDKKDGETWQQVYERLGGIGEKEFKDRFHPTFEIEADKLQLYKRIKHAVSQLIPLFSLSYHTAAYLQVCLSVVLGSPTCLPISRLTRNSRIRPSGSSIG